MLKLDLKTAPIYRLFLSYFLPSLIAMLALSTYSTFDGIFIGKKLGENALAAVGIAWPIFPVLIAYELLFSVGAASMSSYFLGRDNPHRARVVFSSVFYFALFSGVIVGWTLYFWSENIALFLGASEILLPLVVDYIEIIFLGAFVIVLHPLLDIFAINDKQPVLAMVAMVIGSGMNIGLNFIFIFILEWGLSGAALATILGHGIGMIILLQYFLRKKGQLFLIWVFDKYAFLMSAKNGIPQSSSEISVALVMLIFNHIIGNVSGERGLAIYSLLMYIGVVPFTILLSMAQGVQPIASFNYGAKLIKRVKSIFFFGLGVSFFGGIVLYAIFYYFGDYAISWFMQGNIVERDLSFLSDSKRAMNIYFLGYALLGVNIVSAIFFQSIQATLSSFIITLAYNLIFVLIFVLILPQYYGFVGVMSAYPIGMFCATLVTFGIIFMEFKRGVLTKI